MNNNGLVQFIPGVYIRPPNDGIGIQNAHQRQRQGGTVSARDLEFINYNKTRYNDIQIELNRKRDNISRSGVVDKNASLEFAKRKRNLEANNYIKSKVNTFRLKNVVKDRQEKQLMKEWMYKTLEINIAEKSMDVAKDQEQVRVGAMMNNLQRTLNQPPPQEIIMENTLPAPPPPPPPPSSPPPLAEDDFDNYIPPAPIVLKKNPPNTAIVEKHKTIKKPDLQRAFLHELNEKVKSRKENPTVGAIQANLDQNREERNKEMAAYLDQAVAERESEMQTERDKRSEIMKQQRHDHLLIDPSESV
jgi:hypothetical protein